MGHEPVTGGALPSSREAIETEVERLIDLLDLMDPDPDLEPSLGVGGDGTDDDRERDDADDEPSLGAPHGGNRPERHPQTNWCDGADDDREEADDDEPLLGSLHGGERPEKFNQQRWDQGPKLWQEGSCEDAELDDSETELSLGSNAVNEWSSQEQWADGGRADLEKDDSDDEHVLGWTDAQSLAGQLGQGQDWSEPNGDEADTTYSEDEPQRWEKPLDCLEGRTLRQGALSKLEDIQRRRASAPRLVGHHS